MSQSDEFGFDLEENTQENPGWFSEGSVQAIVWDLVDAGGSEGNDLVALGYAPLLDVLRNDVRTGQPLTSLFPFVVALKQRSGVDAAAVSAPVAAQDIVAVNMDAFGGTETNNGRIADALPIYTDIASNGGPVELCGTNAAGSFNMLGNRRFLKFSVPSERLIDIRVANDSAVPADPDPDLILGSRASSTYWNAPARIRRQVAPSRRTSSNTSRSSRPVTTSSRFTSSVISTRLRSIVPA